MTLETNTVAAMGETIPVSGAGGSRGDDVLREMKTGVHLLPWLFAGARLRLYASGGPESLIGF